jgi:hypothetical protein
LNDKDAHIVRPINKRLLLAWFLGIPLSYFATSFLGHFYESIGLILLLAVLVHSFVTLFVYLLLHRAKVKLHSNPIEAGLAFGLLAILTVFVPAMYFMAKPFSYQFDPTLFNLVKPAARIAFLVALIPAFPVSAWAVSIAHKRHLSETRFYAFVDENLGGLIVSFLFFSVYLIFASIFNQSAYDADDIFFDADGNLWRVRFATDYYFDYYWRPAHPYTLIIVRPMVALIAVFFKGNRLFAVFTLNAFIGALCVFLVWYFVKNTVRNSLYALLIASLFGASTTQLAFGSIIETYIYLSAVALIFIVLLLKDRPFFTLVITGLVAFGITISNVGQTFIAHFLIKRNIKQLIIYGAIIGALVVPLSLLNNWIYPEAQPYFWELSTLEAEGHNSFPATLQRANYLGRVMFLHSVVAPEPLVIRDGFPFPKLWLFRASIQKEPMHIASYETWFGSSVAYAWFGLLLLGGVLFLKNLFKQDNRYFFTFILTVLFNFGLYLQYGKDVFLYSTNWTYAIILFLALAWRELAEQRWFQIVLLLFITGLLINNAQLLWTMLYISGPSVR